MEKIKQIYETKMTSPSDINEHLETLYKYSLECDHITEMGVRWVSSTWAFLYANPKKLISYDIVYNPNVNAVVELSKEYGINFNFIETDVLKCEIEKTDLLFIDTLHTYDQLFNELKLHSDKASKYIILHDTTTFGNKDEVIYDHASDIIKSNVTSKVGLNLAVEDFLSLEVGKFWEIHEVFHNNNGLTILKRK